MLPNFRLMIASTLASVVALICGFGMFAAFRVNHEPLGRLPSTAPSLQIAAKAATPTMPVTATEPFAHRFRIGEAADAGGVSALAYAAPQPAVPVADAHETAAAPPETADAIAPSQQGSATPATTETPAAEIAIASVPGSATIAPSEQETAAAESRAEPAIASAPQQPQDATSSATPDATDQPLGVAAIEPLTNPPRPVERPAAEAAPKTAGDAQAASDEAKKKRKRRHFVRIRRPYRAAGFAQDSTFSSSFGQYNFQTAGQYNFQTAVVPKPRSTSTARSNFATGGPFVGAPSR
jgi:hypothetical protein